jgi:hypothetical protein
LISLIGLTALMRSRKSTVLTSHPQASMSKAERQTQLKQSYGALPLSFEVNRGQVDAGVKYLARGSGYSLFLTPHEAVLSLSAASRISNRDAEQVNEARCELANSQTRLRSSSPPS